jgi:hypothetical protein
MALYREQIERAIGPLLNHGFKVVGVLETPKAFGNTELVLASDRLKLRFISDRGQTFVDVARSDAPGWYDLSEVLVALGLRSAAGPWDTTGPLRREHRARPGEARARLRR